MPTLYFITHPEVRFDWSIPVPEWDLSDVGKARLEKLAAAPWVTSLTDIFSSDERKAITTARRLAAAAPNAAPLQFLPELREIDRSAAGTLSPEEYSKVTDQFFANPIHSARGWEPAAAAQIRIASAFHHILKTVPQTATLAIISHGGVGTLLLCHLKNTPIHRSHDQPSQGHYFLLQTPNHLQHSWHPIDSPPPATTHTLPPAPTS